MMNRSGLGISAAFAAFSFACTSADSLDSDPTETTAGRDSGEPTAEPYPVDLDPPSDGVQLKTVGRAIPAGADEEWCEVVELPGNADDTFLVGRTETAMAPFSHHLIISMAPDGSERLDQAPLGQPVECNGAHRFGTGLVTLAASAKPYVSDELPGGIGQILHGGQRLIFNYHSLNTTDEPVPAAHRFNLHFVDGIEKRAQRFGFYNQYIEVPPQSSRSFTDECHFQDDVLVWSLLRHTHRRGTDFSVSWAGGDRDGEHIWTSADWEQDISYRFDEPILVPAGTGFRWECAFDNPTDETLIFGPQATDEMCILFGGFAAAGDQESVPPQSCYRFTP